MKITHILIILAVLSAVAGFVTPARAQTPAPVAILAPLPGQAVQGRVPIQARLPAEFDHADLEFSYSGDATGTWFFITQISPPAAEGALAEWDTTTLTDGNYTLRLAVYPASGEPSVATVPGVRVRNYSPIETDTPAPSATPLPTEPGVTPEPTATATATPTSSPTPTAIITPTPLPPNPAEVSRVDMIASILWGAVVVLGVALVAGVILYLRGQMKK